MIRSGAAAIAAALALSSTQAPGQDAAVDPAVTAEETPVTTDAPAEPAAPSDALAPLAEPEPASEPAASEASEPAPAPAARASRAPARASAPRPAPSATASPADEALSAETPAVVPPAPAVTEAMTAPVAAAKPADDAAPIGPVDEEVGFGLGAAALLALGIGAVAITRRRRRVDEDEEAPLGHVEEEPAAPAHARPEPGRAVRYDPAVIAPAFGSNAGVRPAFAWGNMVTTAAPQRTRETHVERAMRGPTPDNPSLSIRKRLKRAAFFDKREREIAQGKGRPVDRFAGLPQAATSPVPTAAASKASPQRVFEPA